MFKKILFAGAMLLATPAMAATSDDLLALAAKMEVATTTNHQWDKDALTLLQGPALTYANRTLPAPAAAPYYQQGIDLVVTSLRPPAPWTWYEQELINTSTGVVFYVSGYSLWSPPPPAAGTGLKYESGGSSHVNKSAAAMIGALRAWAFILRQDGK